MAAAINNNTNRSSYPWIGWVFQSAVIGLSCGLGYGMIVTNHKLLKDEEESSKETQIRHWDTQRVTNLIHKIQNQIVKSSPRTLLFWSLLVGTCPHAWVKWTWYPLVLFCFHREPPKDDDDNLKGPKGDDLSHSSFSATKNNMKDVEEIMKTPIRTNKKGIEEEEQKQRNVLSEMPAIAAQGDTATVSSNSSSLVVKDGGTSATAPGGGGGERYVEMLVHNVSHTDLVLGVNAPRLNVGDDDNDNINSTNATEKEYCLCRPRFSAFDLYSRRILTSLDQPSSSLSNQRTIASFPRYERSDDIRYTIVTPGPSRKAMLPTGFQLDSDNDTTSNALCIPSEELVNLRFRGRDAPRIEPYLEEEEHPKQALAHEKELLRFTHVFFPLLATLLPRWHQSIASKYSKSGDGVRIKKVLILVTGVGTPRNWTHSITGNSTEACAQLMERYISELYPDVTVRFVHSESNIFRYDENIEFAKHELMPCIDAYRDAHARQELYPDEKEQQQLIVSGSNSSTGSISHIPSLAPFNTEWKQSFAVTLSFADGSPARTHAIQASLRPYRPSYFHFWQLKTFWHDTKICEDDIEAHSFEDMETVPAMEISQTNKREQMVVEEIKRFREEFLETVHSHQNDIRQFWLRKTKKPVLAVLLVEHPERGRILYRGTNMEVSMPTGSLCAERNVIGTALAANPDLKREYLSMVAVLAVPLAPASVAGGTDEKNIPLCQEIPPRPENIRRSMSVTSFASIIEDDDQHDEDSGWVFENVASTSMLSIPKEGSSVTNNNAATTAPANVVTVKKSSPDCSPALGPDVPPAFKLPPSVVSTSTTPKQSPPGTPRRLIALHNTSRLPMTAADLISTDPTATFTSNSAITTTTTMSRNSNKGNLKSGKDTTPKKKKKTVVVHSNEDLNPLRPCGACNEWLKKIAESNPHFKVLTFTDADCNGVYVSPCQE